MPVEEFAVSGKFSGMHILFALMACLFTVLLSGCSRSNPAVDSASPNIRGEPIGTPASRLTASESVAPSQVQAAAKSAPAPADVTPQRREDGGKNSDFAAVTFDKLASYEFVMLEETVTTNGIVSASGKSNNQFPPAVKALDETRVSLKGFMLPLKVESGLVTEMLIMRDQSMCCYGKVPKITEWISVRMTDKGVKAIMDQPITIYGTLHVGEMREHGYLVGIYRMDGDKISVPE